MNDPLELLRAELSVEPSPEFAAKVRARIAREPRRRWTPMIVWSVAAAAAMIVLGVVTQRPAREEASAVAVSPAPAAAAVTAAARPAAPAAGVAPIVPAPRAVAAVAARGADVPRAQPATFEVLVPADQRLAIDGLIRGLNDGRLDPAALAFPSADLQAELVPPPAITVAPIEIPAIGGIDIKK